MPIKYKMYIMIGFIIMLVQNPIHSENSADIIAGAGKGIDPLTLGNGTRGGYLPSGVIYPFKPSPEICPLKKTDEMKNLETYIEKYLHTVTVSSDISKISYNLVWKNNRAVTLEEGFKDNTRFAIASLTKSFTAVGVMHLVESGKINLDDSISKYGLKIENPGLGKITVRMLMQHRSGIPYHKSNPVFPPDTVFIYSNFNYEYLSQLVANVTKMRYQTFMETEIFRPLGMNDTTLSNYHPGSSGIISTPHDLVIFATMLANGGYYKDCRVLSPETIREMLQPPLHEKMQDSTMYYAHGFRVETVKKTIKSFYHTGLWNDCYAEIKVYPKDNASLVQIATPHDFRSKNVDAFKSRTAYLAELYISKIPAADEKKDIDKTVQGKVNN